MRVAVTGANGFIGRATVERLEHRGHKVVKLVRGDTDGTGSHGRGESTVHWNPAAGRIDAGAMEGLDAMIHLAGEPIAARRWSKDQKRRIADSRVNGTRLLAEALAGLESPPSVLVSASAIGWYGNRGAEMLDESSEPGDDFLARVCRYWEDAAEPAKAAGIRVCNPRTGIVLSPSGGALASMLLPFRLGLGGRIGNGRQWMSWITLDDEVSALLWLLDADVRGPMNLTAPNPVTNRDFAAALGRALRRPVLLPTPKVALQARLGRELTESLLYSSARVVPSTLQSGGFEFAHPTLEPALQTMLNSRSR